MVKKNGEKRVDLALSIISELKKASECINQFSVDVESSSREFFKKMHEEFIVEIHDEMDRYKENTHQINELALKLTSTINEWYSFTKDANEMKKLLFPLRVITRKKKLLHEIKRINEKVSELTIENRFLLDKISGWENELGQRTIAKVKKNEQYLSYEKLIHVKDLLISELTYLLPTLCELECDCLDLGRLDSLIEELAVTQASQKK